MDAKTLTTRVVMFDNSDTTGDVPKSPTEWFDAHVPTSLISEAILIGEVGRKPGEWVMTGNGKRHAEVVDIRGTPWRIESWWCNDCHAMRFEAVIEGDGPDSEKFFGMLLSDWLKENGEIG